MIRYFLLLIIATSFLHSSEDCDPLMTQLLRENKETIVVHVKGAICSSCGVGIYFTMRDLEFVDNNRFNGGIELIPKEEIALVAYKDISSINPLSIKQAIDDAGYIATHYCYIEENNFKRVEL